MKAEAAVAAGGTWNQALDAVLAQMPAIDSEDVDLALLFASDEYADDYPALLAAVRARTGAKTLIGCSSQGVIGPGREIEDEPGLALQCLSLPGIELHPARLAPDDIADPSSARVWPEKLGGLKAEDVNAWLFFVDPFSVNGENLLELLGRVNKDVPLIGGLASGEYASGHTYLFLDGDCFDNGAVGLALGGAYDVKTVVSQGAAPIGETWTITGAEGNYVQTLGMRPALEVLMDTFKGLDEATQRRARSNLLVGLAMNEYKDEFQRGDFLIRNLLGVDQDSGSLAIGALPREGQTMQFQLRDPIAADEDLHLLLDSARLALDGRQPVGALLCSCNGRGIGLFGAPDHDARTLSELLGPLPVAGFFCNGEIGPVGAKNYLHGFTASIALIVPKGRAG